MATFNSIDEIKQAILKKSMVAMFNAREKIYSIIYKNLVRYYREYKPEYYRRTWQLFDSLVRISYKDGLGFEVYFDESALNYQTKNVTWLNGNVASASWGAEEILDTAMHGSHGGWIGKRHPYKGDNSSYGVRIWDDSLDEIGDVYKLMKEELIKAGVPIK